jgi:hypothetical protein
MAKPSCNTKEDGLAFAAGLSGGCQGPAPTDLLNLGMLRWKVHSQSRGDSTGLTIAPANAEGQASALNLSSATAGIGLEKHSGARPLTLITPPMPQGDASVVMVALISVNLKGKTLDSGAGSPLSSAAIPEPF